MINKKLRTNSIRKAPIIELLSQQDLSHDVISLGQGIPFFGPPSQSINAIQDNITKKTSYTYSTDAGFSFLREVIVEKLKYENHINANPTNNIIVTAGANQGFMNVLLTITNPGDEVILFSPTYFNYVMGVKLAGCKPVIIPTYHSHFIPDLSLLKEHINSKTKAIITISPNNPTGQIYPTQVVQSINELCEDHQLYHISDEVYEYFVFNNNKHISPLKIDVQKEHTISLFSCSKSFGMSGYRVGFIVISEELFDDVLKVQDTLGIAAPSLSQFAAVPALSMGKSFFNKHLPQIEIIRNQFNKELATISKISYYEPDGAMYFYIKLKTKEKSINIAKKLLRDYKIFTIPGTAFDDTNPSLRISFGNLSEDKSLEGLHRLSNGLNDVL